MFFFFFCEDLQRWPLKKKLKQLFGIVPGTGGGQLSLCVFFSLGEEEKHINKILRKSHENTGTIP